MTTQLPPEPALVQQNNLPDSPGHLVYPVAKLLTPPDDAKPVTIESDTQTEAAGRYTLDGSVVLHYEDRTVQADHIDYDANTGDINATGHLILTGGENQEHITASHGTFNIKSQTGRFYDVSGSVAARSRPQATPATLYNAPADPTTPNVSHQAVYTNGNPFLFTGRIVVKTGLEDYDVYDGTLTSCQLPRPDWLLSAAHISMDGDKARAANSIFHLLNVPILYMPYVTHPIDAEDRQSGLLIPEIGQSTTKGFIIGEQVYLVLNRSMDLTIGGSYYSHVGFADSASFRYKGIGNDFFNARYSQVLDRQPPGITNEGGEDALASGRHDLTPNTRVAGTIEYLSSYIYRQAFDENFNQAVTSDVISQAYAVHQSNGIETAIEADRYQGIKVIQTTTATGEQVHIFHAPALIASATDHRLRNTNLEASFEASAAGLTRTQPNFATSGIIGRIDLHPELAYPIHIAGWNLRPALALRETLYTRSRLGTVAGQSPVESTAGLSRSSAEVTLEIRPPAIERTFALNGTMARLFGTELRHTLEPAFTYRYTAGISNFLDVLRFDAIDVASNTDEFESSLTQRVFLRPRSHAKCNTAKVAASPGLEPEQTADNLPAESGTCPNEAFLTWRLTQKTFFDQQFGGAVVVGRRNIFDTTLAFSGVAFLTEPRGTSPILSRLRMRTTANTDLEWDADYDAGAKKFNSSNLFLDLHQGNYFGALSYARLDAPGRFYTQGVSSTTSNFSQMRVLAGVGMPTRRGLSLATNAGINLDAGSSTSTIAATTTTPAITTTTSSSLLQYAALQASYNWNCCGLSVEYRKYELGSVRNEGVYRFNFTLANIGTAGNLKRAERLF